MPGNRALLPFDYPYRQAWMGTDFDAQAAANTARLHHGPILVPQFVANSRRTQRANADAGATNAPVYPGITGAAIDLGNAQIDFAYRCAGKRIGGTDLHAFTAQRTSLDLGIDIRGTHLAGAIAFMKAYAFRGTYFTAHSATDTGSDEGVIVLQRAGWAQVHFSINVDRGRHGTAHNDWHRRRGKHPCAVNQPRKQVTPTHARNLVVDDILRPGAPGPGQQYPWC